MSTLMERPSSDAEAPGKLVGGAIPANWSIERLYDPKVIAEMLYRTKELTDEGFEDLVDDIGARAARLILRAQAVSGNIKALELYFRIVKETKASRRSKDVKVSATPENAAFVRVARTVD